MFYPSLAVRAGTKQEPIYNIYKPCTCFYSSRPMKGDLTIQKNSSIFLFYYEIYHTKNDIKKKKLPSHISQGSVDINMMNVFWAADMPNSKKYDKVLLSTIFTPVRHHVASTVRHHAYMALQQDNTMHSLSSKTYSKTYSKTEYPCITITAISLLLGHVLFLVAVFSGHVLLQMLWNHYVCYFHSHQPPPSTCRSCAALGATPFQEMKNCWQCHSWEDLNSV